MNYNFFFVEVEGLNDYQDKMVLKAIISWIYFVFGLDFMKIYNIIGALSSFDKSVYLSLIESYRIVSIYWSIYLLVRFYLSIYLSIYLSQFVPIYRP